MSTALSKYSQTPYLESIGSGMRCPDCFNDVLGRVAVNVGLERINQSIYYILTTRIGERWGYPTFGSKLKNLLFTDNTALEFEVKARIYIEDALKLWEKRIVLTSVVIEIETQGTTVPITIYYYVRNSNIKGSYVYPFTNESMSVEEGL